MFTFEGYRQEEFLFEDHPAVIVFPSLPRPDRAAVFKMIRNKDVESVGSVVRVRTHEPVDTGLFRRETVAGIRLKRGHFYFFAEVPVTETANGAAWFLCVRIALPFNDSFVRRQCGEGRAAEDHRENDGQ